jgi:DNA invertase Pin-like site-specific DNA recombinase
MRGRSPGPATLNIWADEYQRLLDRLNDETLKRIAVLKMQGSTIDEIADELGCARRTVNRKLDLIWKILLPEAQP